MKMLNTSEYLELAELLADEIISLPVSRRYKELQHEVQTDNEIKMLVSTFEKAKLAYEDVQRYGSKHHPDYKKVTQQLIDAKSNLFQNTVIKELKSCESEIQEILNQITVYMKNAIKVDYPKKGSSCGCSGGGCSR